MKVSCLQENLSRGLAIVGRAVASRAPLTVTQNVLLETDRSMLKLSATNLEIAITTWIGAMIGEEGAVTAPARLFSEYVNSLPGDRIDLDLDSDNEVLNFVCGRAEAKIHGIKASEFPPIPQVADGVTARIGAQEFKRAIGRVAFASAAEESRPVLTGVHVRLSGNQFTLAAADGFRLAVQRGELAEPVEGETAVIVPARTMHELVRLLGDHDDPVEMMMVPNRGQILFKIGSIEVVSQLVQGTFPNYDQLIPQRYDTRAIFDLEKLQRAARSAAIFARDGSNIIRLTIAPEAAVVAETMTEVDATAQEEEEAPVNELPSNGSGAPSRATATIFAKSDEVGENEDKVDVEEIEGGEAKIAFNYRYLQDVLGAMDRGKVVLETTSSSSPGVFKPIDSDDYVHVVMPMFVQW